LELELHKEKLPACSLQPKARDPAASNNENGQRSLLAAYRAQGSRRWAADSRLVIFFCPAANYEVPAAAW